LLHDNWQLQKFFVTKQVCDEHFIKLFIQKIQPFICGEQFKHAALQPGFKMVQRIDRFPLNMNL